MRGHGEVYLFIVRGLSIIVIDGARCWSVGIRSWKTRFVCRGGAYEESVLFCWYFVGDFGNVKGLEDVCVTPRFALESAVK